MSRDGWVKRQKEVKDLSTTRLREGDAVLAAFAGSTRATCVFFTNFGVAYTCRIIDVPASTGYGEPIQRLFKLKDGEKIVGGAQPRSARRSATSSRRQSEPDAAPPVHAVAVTSDGYACGSASSRSSSRARARAAASPDPRRARRWSAWRKLTGERNADCRDRRGARAAVQGRRSELPVGPGQRRDPHQARPTTTGCSASSRRPAIATC